MDSGLAKPALATPSLTRRELGLVLDHQCLAVAWLLGSALVLAALALGSCPGGIAHHLMNGLMRDE